MKEIFGVWKSTRGIVLTAFTAAIYAGTLIPFKPIQIVPGLTELRPASVIPVLFGILFGPAAAWGSAIGNLIADFFGMLSPVSAFGFVANFFFSYVAFGLWRALVKTVTLNIGQIGLFVVCGIAASLVCAAIVASGAQLLGFAPFRVLFLVIFINNALMTGILGPVLMKLLYARVRKMGMLYEGA
jgi:energy-coupling factor transport system substrate-specific component